MDADAHEIKSRELESRIRRGLPRFNDESITELLYTISRLVASLHPAQIYLFGSQARGDAKPDSDVDILVVVPQSDLLPYQLDQQAYRAVGWHTLPIEILVMTASEFESRSRARSSLPAAVLREGQLLYAA